MTQKVAEIARVVSISVGLLKHTEVTLNYTFTQFLSSAQTQITNC